MRELEMTSWLDDHMPKAYDAQRQLKTISVQSSIRVYNGIREAFKYRLNQGASDFSIAIPKMYATTVIEQLGDLQYQVSVLKETEELTLIEVSWGEKEIT